MSPPTIDLAALRERMETPVADISATSSISAAADTDARGFIYWPNLLGRHQLTNLDLKETRRKSQWLCTNTSARVLRRLANYVGTSMVKADTNDSAFNTAVTRWWREEYQGRAGNYDTSGYYSSESFLTNCLYLTWRDGDCLAVHLNKRDGEPTCQAIEANRIDQSWNWTPTDKWQDGVLTNGGNRHLAYSIMDDPPGQFANWNPNYKVIGAGHAFMFMERESHSSVRGTPALIHAVPDLLDEREIHNALVSVVKAHAQVGYVFEREAGTSPGSGIPQLPPGAKSREIVQPGSPNTATTKGTAGVRTKAEVMDSANILNLDPGMKAKVLADGRDHPNETEIKNGIFQKLAMGLGLPVQAFILLDQLTGPGVRLVLRQTQDWRERWLKYMETFQSTDYARRVEWAMRTGRLPKCKDPNPFRHCFIRPRAITIDDGRTAASQVMALNAGITNLASIHGENGDDWKEETDQGIEELAHILKKCEEKGVEPELYFARQAAAAAMAQGEAQAEAARAQAESQKPSTAKTSTDE